jgi:sugar/nucleoside kinase (ribokinase family)/DNA-binding CsgD family transcriptional regulator
VLSVALTEREREIVALLRRDPLIGSEAIAERLGTSRSAVNVHLSNLGKKGVILGRGYVLGERPGVVVIGGANVDIKARSTDRIRPATSNPGWASMTPGGVGRNVAENLARLGVRTFLVSSIGRDALGDGLLSQTVAAGVRCDYVQRTELATGTYTAVLDADGELIVAVSDMAAVDALGPGPVNEARDVITTAGLLVLDGNLAMPALTHAGDLAAAAQVRTILEPVSVPKAARIASAISADRPLYAVTPNRDELAALTGLSTRTDKQLQKAADSLHARGVDHVWVRLGDRGSLFSSASSGAVWLPAGTATVADVTGAGDAMLAAFCYAVLNDKDPIEAARYGQAAALLTLASPHTVRPDLTPRLIETALVPAR